MAMLRQLLTVHRRWLFSLVLMALCARALVPAGWMPVAGPHGMTLAFCDGAGPVTPMATSMAMPMKRGQPPMQHHQGAPDHPCAFTAAAAAVTLGLPAAPPLLSVVQDQPVPAPPAATIGRGLAAPPPPPTGPPAFA